jgi:protein TonB
MKKHFLLLLLLISIQLLGQTAKNGTIKIKKVDTIETIFDSVNYADLDELPEFPGGNQALLTFLNSNIIYPDNAKNNGVSGTVYISFVINPDGKLTDAKIVRRSRDCSECDLEALRVILLMPDWIPGKQKGKPVKVKYMFPIKFNLR